MTTGEEVVCIVMWSIFCLLMGWQISAAVYHRHRIEKLEERNKHDLHTIQYWKNIAARVKDHLTSKEKFLLLCSEESSGVLECLKHRHRWRVWYNVKAWVLIKWYVLRNKIRN